MKTTLLHELARGGIKRVRQAAKTTLLHELTRGGFEKVRRTIRASSTEHIQRSPLPPGGVRGTVT